jgi:hypothetical protein
MISMPVQSRERKNRFAGTGNTQKQKYMWRSEMILHQEQGQPVISAGKEKARNPHQKYPVSISAAIVNRMIVSRGAGREIV